MEQYMFILIAVVFIAVIAAGVLRARRKAKRVATGGAAFAPLPAQPMRPGTFALFGDSLSVATGEALQKVLGREVVNHAVAGSTSLDAIMGRLPYGPFTQYIANDPAPNVIIRYGIVDALTGISGEFAQRLTAMVTAAMLAGKRVYIVGAQALPAAGNAAQFIYEYQNVDRDCERVATTLGATYIHIMGVPLGEMLDTIHPAPSYQQDHVVAIANGIALAEKAG